MPIADIYIVERIKYPSKRNKEEDSDEESGKISCVCTVF